MCDFKPRLKNDQECTGCGACIASCTQNAIFKSSVGFGSWIPEINENKCISCGICESICKRMPENENTSHRAYVAYNLNDNIRLRSASGGVFSAIATYILEKGGSVFGAEMTFRNGKAVVEHNCITQISELYRLLGSKYVQSDCFKSFQLVKHELNEGRKVLFSGCSCQIVGLKNYLGNINQSNLYTIDLICHGVPGVNLFNDYISFLQNKYKGKVSEFTFRTKENGGINYIINCKIGSGISKNIKIPMERSGYYRMFINQESYREACYYCKYATLDKPADLTIGDYFELAEDYPEILVGENPIDCRKGISCIITNTAKGDNLLKEVRDYMYLKEVDPLVVQASHGNLNHPSQHSKVRDKLLKRYREEGYAAIEKYYFRRYILICIKRFARTILRF